MSPKASCCSTKKVVAPAPTPVKSCCALKPKQEPEETATPLTQIPPAKKQCSPQPPGQRIQPAPPNHTKSSCCASKAPKAPKAPPQIPLTQPNVQMVQERAPPWGFNINQDNTNLLSQNVQFALQSQLEQSFMDPQYFQSTLPQQQQPPPPPPSYQNGSPQDLSFNFNSSVPCACGDGCQCLGCATHPHNDATTSHFQQLGYNMLSTSDWWGQEADSPVGGNGSGQFSPGQGILGMNGHGNGNGIMNGNGNGFGGHDGVAFMPQQHQMQNNAVNGAEYFTPYNQAQHQPQWPQQPQQPQPQSQQQPLPQLNRHHSISNSAAINATNLTMQPSAYTEIIYPVPLSFDPSSSSPFPYLFSSTTNNAAQDCSNTHGTCLCGDDCDCVGCLTHDGHNGISIEANPGFGGEEGLGLGLGDGGGLDGFGIGGQGARL